MATIQAAVLLAKLEVFDEEVRRRDEVGTRYTELLQGVVKTPQIHQGNTSVYAQYTIEVDARDEFQEQMKRLGIPTAVHYPQALHLQPAFTHLGHREGDFPVAEAAARRVVSLPMHPYLTEEDLVEIAAAVTECAEKTRGNMSLRGAALV